MDNIIGSTIERIHETDSTNNYAVTQLLTKRLPEGVVFIADSQIDGRGLASGKWESESNMNLTFSIILYPGFLEIRRQFEISKVISLGVADYLKDQTGEVSVKWPNDLYIGDGKVGGILIENAIRINRITSCIVGIGLNINQQLFRSNAPNPVSLSQVTGKVYNLETALSDLCLKIDYRYQQLFNGAYLLIDKDYTRMLYRRGFWHWYTDENGDFEGKLLGVDQIGQLRIEARSGKINNYQFKEVNFK
jgi:BirA family biotin operon repressor/biotin-[acetyl-CoA-carboxylase] ligase